MVGEDLIKNVKRIWKSASTVYFEKDYTSSTILSFKVLFGLIDYILLSKKGLICKDHSARFKLVKQWLPEIYMVLDKNFPTYQNTYTSSIEKEVCDNVRHDVQQIAEEYSISLDD